MKTQLISGTCTALVTPFEGDKVNYDMLHVLLIRQIAAGVKSIVIAGTTGEAPTLSDEEKAELFKAAKETVGKNASIIVGSGSNCTEHAVKLSKIAEQAGADGLLIVSPYYNKATQSGIIAHYKAIAESTDLPIVVYNVPSRTGLDIPTAVYQKLAEIPNITGVKEASASIGKILDIRSTCPEDFYIWSGNDNMAVPVMALGGKGIISVASNIVPRQMVRMSNAALSGDFKLAAEIQIALKPLNGLLFSEVNPIPVKQMLKEIGYDCGLCRLPLTNPSPETMEQIQSYVANASILRDEIPRK